MKKITFLFLLSIQTLLAQNYKEYITGNAIDVTTNHQAGVCLMGGASEQENAMIWFLNQSNGGDIVVLRADDSDGYNDYFYTDLGVNVNSVRTFVINNTTGAIDPYVLEKINNAEAIWFAGGDQYDYVKYFKDNVMEDALNAFINTKKGVIGGTSAGMAILGSSYFSAQYGTLDSTVALSNPYHPRVQLGYNDFLKIPFMEDVITDSHFANRDREARLSVFLARFSKDNNRRSFGIACNEYTAICVGLDGKAIVYGDYPKYPTEVAYFLQASCVPGDTPETVVAGTAVTWNRNGEAIKVYKVPGTKTGTNYFDLSDWKTGNGGAWENWSINNGTFATASGTNPMCAILSTSEVAIAKIQIYPNPVSDKIFIKSKEPVDSVKIYNILGKEISVNRLDNLTVDVSSLSAGLYLLKLNSGTSEQTFKIIKK